VGFWPGRIIVIIGRNTKEHFHTLSSLSLSLSLSLSISFGVFCSFLFLSLWQIPEKKLHKGRIYLGSQFQRFQSMVHWFWCCGLEVRLNTLLVSIWLSKIAHLRVDRKQREEKGQRTKHIFPGHAPSGLLPPTKPHLLLSATCTCNMINDLIAWIRQRINSLTRSEFSGSITSPNPISWQPSLQYMSQVFCCCCLCGWLVFFGSTGV
jgi:hypothetical protein